MDPLEFLFSLERLGMKFGLDNMRALCQRLDHPERCFRSVVVAGTNGKGSVTAITAAALTAAGHAAGRYTSPHLQRLEERFVLRGRDVSTADLRQAAATVGEAARALVEDRILETLPTFFECTTAIAFELFRRAGIEIAVLEVGLGGRLDATNVVTPIAAAIVSIDFDHQALLGNTLDAIAAEKAGVVKAGVPLVCGPVPEAARQVIAAICAERRAPLVEVTTAVEWHTEVSRQDTQLHVRTGRRHLPGVVLRLPGVHQGVNAAVAVALLDVLDAQGLTVPDAAVVAGLSGVEWPARLERRTWRGAELLLDAAHNPAGARALASYLETIGWQGCTLVIGALADKDVAGVAAALAPLAGLVICTTPDNPRALAASALADLMGAHVRPGVDVMTITSPRAAAERACQPGGRVVAAGSIFLVGSLRGILR